MWTVTQTVIKRIEMLCTSSSQWEYFSRRAISRVVSPFSFSIRAEQFPSAPHHHLQPYHQPDSLRKLPPKKPHNAAINFFPLQLGNCITFVIEWNKRWNNLLVKGHREEGRFSYWYVCWLWPSAGASDTPFYCADSSSAVQCFPSQSAHLDYYWKKWHRRWNSYVQHFLMVLILMFCHWLELLYISHGSFLSPCLSLALSISHFP